MMDRCATAFKGTHATQAGCCAQCMAVPLCELWVHAPSTDTCWLMRPAGPKVREVHTGLPNTLPPTTYPTSEL